MHLSSILLAFLCHCCIADLSKYRILGEIGQGITGKVYSAISEEGGVPVAIKIPSSVNKEPGIQNELAIHRTLDKQIHVITLLDSFKVKIDDDFATAIVLE